MKERLFFLVFLTLFSLSFISETFAEYYDYDDVLLVCNNNSAISMQICSYFVQQRNIPQDHIVYLNCSTSETINREQFNETIRKPIENFLISHNLVDEINYIVTTKGVPLRISGASDKASVDSELMLILGPYANQIGRVTSYDWGSRLISPYFQKDEIFSRKKFGIYLVTRLTGYNFSEVKKIIDLATLARENASLGIKPNGTFVIDVDPTRDSGGYKVGNDWMREAKEILENSGWNVTFDNTTIWLMNQKNVLGYVSWGSNDANSQNHGKPNNTYVPGAIGETYVSTSGRTFTWPPSYGQSLVADLIAEGITGVKGYVYEPYLDAMARPNILFDRYTKGYILADSYWMASKWLSWRGVVVGDPKTYIVFNSRLIPSIRLESPLNGQKIRVGTIINLTVWDYYGNLDKVWYSLDNGSNVTLEEPWDINTSEWSLGKHNLTVYANNTLGYLSLKTFNFETAEVKGECPKYSTFDGDTTDLKSLWDYYNVSNLVLEKAGFGKIEFNENVNVSGYDFDKYITIGYNYIELDSEHLPNLNVSANLTLYGIKWKYPIILVDGKPCEDCEIISYENGVLKFKVNHFTAYSSSPNAELVIWDENDENMPYANQSRGKNELIWFYANYTNKTSDLPIENADCKIYFDDLNASMIYNSTIKLYVFNRSFESNGYYKWRVECNASNYDPLNASDWVKVGETCGINITSCTTIDEEGFYCLTQDLVNVSSKYCINITASNVWFNCMGHVIDGIDLDGSIGIWVKDVKNVRVLNCSLSDWGYGIEFENVNGSRVENVTLEDNNYGFYLYKSNNNTLADIFSFSNNYGFYFSLSYYNTLINITTTTNEDGVTLANSNYNHLTNIFSIQNNDDGISLGFSSNNHLINITSTNNDDGIYLYYSNNNHLTNIFSIQNNDDGISLGFSSNNHLINITSTNNDDGIYLYYSNNNYLNNSQICSNNNYDIYLYSSSLTGFNNTCDITNGFVCEHYCPCLENVSYITVCKSGNCNFTSIREAVNNACLNTLIEVLDKETYNEYITIRKDNITLNCNGATLKGSGSENGIWIGAKTNVTIENCKVENFDYGIFISYSSNITLINITSSNNYRGLYLSHSSNNTLINITSTNNNDGLYLSHSSNNYLNNSQICSNNNYDIYLYSSSLTGFNNTCDSTYNYNDQGTTGCTWACPCQITFTQISYPTTYSNKPFIYLNPTISPQPSNFTYYLYNQTSLINSTFLETYPTPINFTNLKEGIYFVNITALRTKSWLTKSKTVEILIDWTKPSILSINYPNKTEENQLVEIVLNTSDNFNTSFANLTFNQNHFLFNKTFNNYSLTLNSSLLDYGLNILKISIFDLANNSISEEIPMVKIQNKNLAREVISKTLNLSTNFTKIETKEIKIEIKANSILNNTKLHMAIFEGISKNKTLENRKPLKTLEIRTEASPYIEKSRIVVFYDENELRKYGINEDSLKLYYFNESLQDWQLVENQTLNTKENYIETWVSHFSTYTIFGKTENGYPCYSNEECASNYCVHGICRPSCPYCGDGYCDLGEDKFNCPIDCGYWFSSPYLIQYSNNSANITIKVISKFPKPITLTNFILTSISFKPKEVIFKAKILISSFKQFNTKPKDVKVFSFFNLSHEGISFKDFDQINVSFRIDKNWIKNERINVSTISLFRFEDGKWEYQPTQVIGEDENYIYFESTLTGLSTFAIGGKELLKECPFECCINESGYKNKYCTPGYTCINHTCIKIKKECKPCLPCTDWSECVNGIKWRVCYYCNESTNFTCQPFNQTVRCKKPIAPIEKAALIALIMLVLFLFLLKLKTNRR